MPDTFTRDKSFSPAHVGDFVRRRTVGTGVIEGSVFSRNRVVDWGLHYLMLLLGLSLMSLGIAFSIRSALGTTPISSLPYALSLLTPLSVGALMILLNLVFVGLQSVILR